MTKILIDEATVKLALEALADNRHYIVERESAAYLEIYDESIAAVEKALAEQPAQRTWVGLTDEEADKIYKDGSTFGEMMRMVEAKLKEKNNGN